MPSQHDPGLHFVVQMALRDALKLVRGLRKQISEAEESVIAGKMLDEIAHSSYRIVQDSSGPKGLDPFRIAVIDAQRIIAEHVHPDSGKDCEATITALLAILDHKELLRALADAANAKPDAEPPPGI